MGGGGRGYLASQIKTSLNIFLKKKTHKKLKWAKIKANKTYLLSHFHKKNPKNWYGYP